MSVQGIYKLDGKSSDLIMYYMANEQEFYVDFFTQPGWLGERPSVWAIVRFV